MGMFYSDISYHTIFPPCRYKDASKTSFKSSTRLECMMQDYPKTLPPSARVGFTVNYLFQVIDESVHADATSWVVMLGATSLVLCNYAGNGNMARLCTCEE